jgi:hypothetical protein
MLFYSDDQPRDERGRWGGGAELSSGEKATLIQHAHAGNAEAAHALDRARKGFHGQARAVHAKLGELVKNPTKTSELDLGLKDGMRPQSIEKVKAERASGKPMRPVDVDVYTGQKPLLADGRHRLEVAREQGDHTIQARVTHYNKSGDPVRTEHTSLKIDHADPKYHEENKGFGEAKAAPKKPPPPPASAASTAVDKSKEALDDFRSGKPKSEARSVGARRGAEKKQESNQRVENDIPDHLKSYWNKVKSKFSGTSDRRAEQFAEHVQSHRSEVDRHIADEAERKFGKMERAHLSELRKAPRQIIGHDGAPVPFSVPKIST